MYIYLFLCSTAKHQATLLEWLNGILPDLRMPVNASDEEIRGCLIDGSVLCRILNRLKPGSVAEVNHAWFGFHHHGLSFFLYVFSRVAFLFLRHNHALKMFKDFCQQWMKWGCQGFRWLTSRRWLNLSLEKYDLIELLQVDALECVLDAFLFPWNLLLSHCVGIYQSRLGLPFNTANAFYAEHWEI